MQNHQILVVHGRYEADRFAAAADRGEVALGVITGLTLAIIPVGLLGLDFLLNAIQALIFSVLTLMFIVLAIESHHEEEGHIAEEAIDQIEGKEPAGLQPAH